MADNSRIEWTDASWNPLRARNTRTGKVGWFCVHVSEGCRNCYAEGFNRRLGTGVDYKPQALKAGQVEVFLDPVMLTQPLRWKKPRRIFVGSMTDLFADFVTDDQLDEIFAVMALAPQHTLQVLTKRPERMRAYLTDPVRRGRIQGQCNAIGVPIPPRASAQEAEEAEEFVALSTELWPLPNVWLGVSVEDQARADERIPPLLATPAAARWISAEPLLGPVDLSVIADTGCPNSWDGLMMDPTTGVYECCSACDYTGLSGEWGIDWVVAGGESGRGARPMHPDWARQLRDQCGAAGVPFLFKQWGDWTPIGAWSPADRRPQIALARDGRRVDYDVAPEDVPGGQRLMRTGKKAAGRLLDGQLHDAFPEARP